MNEATIKVLKKLSAGKNGLPLQSLLALVAELRSASDEEIAAAVAPKPKGKAAAPQWLTDMSAAQKRIKWTPVEAVDTLFDVALRHGLISVTAAQERPAKLSFAKAAERIAAHSSGEALKRAFVAFVDDHTAANARR